MEYSVIKEVYKTQFFQMKLRYHLEDIFAVLLLVLRFCHLLELNTRYLNKLDAPENSDFCKIVVHSLRLVLQASGLFIVIFKDQNCDVH